ncbi:MAG: acetate kinase [Verrucomicrobia bacterium]|nr:acetate kinase [Verrucomicrobiota bacterium]MBS0637388.1 acetate kinase [Verrucomicrobiota bacterium]
MILTVNAGSSSVKYALYDKEKLVDSGVPDAIGHRVVHGGALYTKSVLIDDEVLKNLKRLSKLAPLHNGPAIELIEECQKKYDVPQVAVFDTAYFRQMPAVSRFYAISPKYGIERFGFHGISHSYLWKQYLAQTGNASGKIITLHLGSGCSAAAIDSGRPIDTSMGYTPNEGLVMATRSGNIDPQVVETITLEQLNRESGLLGLSGLSDDMRELLKVYETNERARFAVDLFCYRIVHYIGAYTAILGQVDAIVFSGGIGENSPEIRGIVTKQLHTPPPILVIPTNENLEIARETERLINSGS